MAQIFNSPAEDAQMNDASAQARENFRFFWRELTWEFRRIIPALTISQAKFIFDDPEDARTPNYTGAEHMWVELHSFDGDKFYGELSNQPRGLTSVSQGDFLAMEFAQLTDWLYAYDDAVFGAYSINLMRSRMPKRARKAHDKAWGLNFGDPEEIKLVPAEWLGAVQGKGLFKKKIETQLADPNSVEHPMALNMNAAIQSGEIGDIDIHACDDQGKTVLHDMAMAGAKACVQTLLNMGAKKSVKNKAGYTAADLAGILGWDETQKLLK